MAEVPQTIIDPIVKAIRDRIAAQEADPNAGPSLLGPEAVVEFVLSVGHDWGLITWDE